MDYFIPRVGLSGSIIINKEKEFSGYRRAYASEDYAQAITKHFGAPVILPVTDNRYVIERYLDMIDALVLTGGYDIAPRFYNEEPSPKLGEVLPERDEFELKLLEYAIERQIPILGICRGMQLMNVYFGGSLYQDMSDYKDLKVKHDQVDGPTIATHTIDIKKGSKLFQAFGKEEALVNSFHHQALNKVADVFEVTARAKDGVVEAIEHKDYLYMMGVQFHPEMMFRNDSEMDGVFREFLGRFFEV